MRDFRVYLATEADWPKLPRIYEAASYTRAAAGMRERASWEVEEFLRGDRLIYLAEADGTPVGTVALVFRGQDAGLADGVTSAHINRLHVVQGYRRRGIARRLMVQAEQEAHRRGYALLTLEVEDDNEPGRRLYESLGYKYTGRGSEPVNMAMTKTIRPLLGEQPAS